MGTPCAIGLDIGLSTTKAVAFTAAGDVIASSTRESVNSLPKPRWVERDPQTFRTMILEVLTSVAGKLEGYDIVGLSLAAHGDGVWLADENKNILRPGILSLDSRARSFAAEFSAEPLATEIRRIAGQLPIPSSAGPELRWLKENEPEVYRRIRWVMFSKDVVRLWLTGEVCQDFTEASSGYTDVATQEVSPGALEILGIGEMARCVPPVKQSAEVAGAITADVARITGIPQGTPVAAGMHDMVAGAVGVGAIGDGDVSVIAGTYCINQLVRTEPVQGEWLTRSFTSKGLWNICLASPSSSTNLDWFAHTMLPDQVAASKAVGEGSFGFMDAAFDDLEPLSEGSPYYLPFLFGSPLPVDASAALVGLRAWHTRADATRAVLEGIALNHRWHLDRIPMPDAAVPKVMGGVSRNPLWSQMMANLLNREIEMNRAKEPGALGVAMAAFVAVGVFPDLAAAVQAMVKPGRRVVPNDDAAFMWQRYERYESLQNSLRPWWA